MAKLLGAGLTANRLKTWRDADGYPVEADAAVLMPSGFAVGDLLYASGVATLAKLPIVAAGQVLVSGATPAWSASPTLTSVTASSMTSGSYLFSGDNNGDIGGANRVRNVYVGTSVVTPLIGTATDVLAAIQVNGGIRWYVGASAAAYTWFPNADNANDIGNSTSRVRTGYFGTALVVGTNPSTTGAVRLAHASQINGRDSTNATNVIIADWGSTADTLQLGQAGFDTVLAGRVRMSSVGPHAIGGAASSLSQLLITGSFAERIGVEHSSTIAPPAGTSGRGHWNHVTFTEAASGVHTLLAAHWIDAATVTAGVATVTDTASLYIAGAMAATVSGKNYAAWIAGGLTRLDGGVQLTAVAFASVPAAPAEGTMIGVTDSTTAVWGATITGGGANHVLAYYNGTNWTVAGK